MIEVRQVPFVKLLKDLVDLMGLFSRKSFAPRLDHAGVAVLVLDKGRGLVWKQIIYLNFEVFLFEYQRHSRKIVR